MANVGTTLPITGWAKSSFNVCDNSKNFMARALFVCAAWVLTIRWHAVCRLLSVGFERWPAIRRRCQWAEKYDTYSTDAVANARHCYAQMSVFTQTEEKIPTIVIVKLLTQSCVQSSLYSTATKNGWYALFYYVPYYSRRWYKIVYINMFTGVDSISKGYEVGKVIHDSSIAVRAVFGLCSCQQVWKT